MSPTRAAPAPGRAAPSIPTPPRERVAQAVDRARRLLPAQGPIDRFVHHNTLHAFEHLPFEAAVREAREVLGGEPYLDEARYREELARGRIREADLEVELDRLEAAPPDLPPDLPVRGLRRALLLRPTHEAGGPALAWLLADGGLARRLSPAASEAARARVVADTRAWLAPRAADPRAAGEALTGEADPARADALLREAIGRRLDEVPACLWRDPEALAVAALSTACRRRAVADPAAAPAPVRHRDRLFLLTGEDPDDLTHPALIRWVSAFLDQGVAYWPMPLRERGLLGAFVALAGRGPGLEAPFLRGLGADLARLAGAPAEAVVEEVLRALGVPEAAWDDHVARALLALPGWGGMVAALEADPALAPVTPVPARLVDLLAVRLLLERRALEDVARRHLGPDARLDALPAPPAPAPDPGRAAWRLRQACELVGAAAPAVLGWSDAQVAALLREAAAFGSLERRALWQRAYERAHREQVLAALEANRGRAPAAPAPLQVVTCLDERSEGLRRHLEEAGGAAVETVGAAGFFGLAIAFRGLDDARHAALCPVAARPAYEVQERAAPSDARAHVARRRRRRLLAGLGFGALVGSRALVRGAAATLAAGLAAAVPLVLRTLFPRGWALLAARLGHALVPRPRTALTALREGDDVGPTGLPLGLGVDEAADGVARLLEDVGLAGRVGRLVAVVGHGATTVNNPHASAYDCGACGGRQGGPNARLFAALANDPRVRAALAARGVAVPPDAWFVAAAHDTTTDAVAWLDLDLAPAARRADLADLAALLERARALTALERCRRFATAPADLTPADALAHVEARALDLAEPRPEYNHGTNAVLVVGRRALTRGLFLDRRAFLASYDPTTDADGRVLARLLGAALPVCAGINLEYYFSTVDNERYGCGTKLPHNVAGLLGVMNGHQGDLRTGLPWQTVDIHEPLRLLVVVEAAPATLLEVARGDPALAALVLGRWVQVACVDPATGATQVLGPEGPDGLAPFAPPPGDLARVPTSSDWTAGRREHLAPALVAAGLPQGGAC
ncbi:MAG: DUF2309 domain-containing protein [Planctomycetes bacterium]|nr:DUF2309 domain-containing protein [Planctomycetota bacterium]